MNADLPPVHHTFELGAEITEVQQRFLDEHGFLHFSGVLSLEEVALAHAALNRVEADHVEHRRTHVNGVPLFWGRKGDGERRLQRSAFTSLFSDDIRQLVHDDRFEPIRRLSDTTPASGTEKWMSSSSIATSTNRAAFTAGSGGTRTG